MFIISEFLNFVDIFNAGKCTNLMCLIETQT